MALYVTENQPLLVVDDENATDLGWIHIPTDARVMLQTTAAAHCGVRGTIGIYLGDEYELEDVDFCVDCAQAQREVRDFAAIVKGSHLDAALPASCDGSGVAVPADRPYSTSLDVLYQGAFDTVADLAHLHDGFDDQFDV